MIIHVGMNIPDKPAVFAEVRRLLKPGGTFGLYEQMQVGEGVPNYPLPWAEDERSSFVEAPEAYALALESNGFVVEQTEDRRRATAGPPGPEPRLSPAAVFGPSFAERIGNNISRHPIRDPGPDRDDRSGDLSRLPAATAVRLRCIPARRSPDHHALLAEGANDGRL